MLRVGERIAVDGKLHGVAVEFSRAFDGQRLRRRRSSRPESPLRRELCPRDSVVAADWVAANGITTGPAIEELATPPGELPVTRKTWTKPGAHPVTLYRIDGGGHGWPGGPLRL